LGVFTFLPTGLLPIFVRIFSKFREISQICEYRENEKPSSKYTPGIYIGKYPGKYPVNSKYPVRYLPVFIIAGIYLVFTWKLWPKVKTGKYPGYPGYLSLGICIKVFTRTLVEPSACRSNTNAVSRTTSKKVRNLYSALTAQSLQFVRCASRTVENYKCLRW